MAIGDTSTPQSQARLADLGQRLASLEAAHLGALVAALEAPPRVRGTLVPGDPGPTSSENGPGRCWWAPAARLLSLAPPALAGLK